MTSSRTTFRVVAAVMTLVAFTSALAQEAEHAIDIETTNVHTILISGDFLDLSIEGITGTFDGSWRGSERRMQSTDEGTVIGPPGIKTIINDGRLIVRTEGDAHHYVLDLQIPATWNVRVQVYRLGEVRLRGIKGELSTWSAQGPIVATDQHGPFSITAMSGVVRVDYAGTALAAPSAISARAPGPSDVAIAFHFSPSLSFDMRVASAGTVVSDLAELREALAQSGAHASVNGGGEPVTLRSAAGKILVSTSPDEGEE